MYFDPNLKCHYRVKSRDDGAKKAMYTKIGICAAFALIGVSAVYIVSRAVK